VLDEAIEELFVTLGVELFPGMDIHAKRVAVRNYIGLPAH